MLTHRRLSLLALSLVGLFSSCGVAESLDGSDIYVPYDEQWRCPPLSTRNRPELARDVRPDDIRVVAALGDSITAGFVARTNRRDRQYLAPDQAQTVLLPPIQELREYRGLSYPIGGDFDALTLPNILAHYVPDLTGASRGDRALAFEVDSLMSADDGLNAANGGATSQVLLAQVSERLLPAMKRLHIDMDAWTFTSIGIGANDICAFCHVASNGTSAIGSPEDFALGIKDAVDLLRRHVPNLIVNIIGTFRVSAIYNITSRDPYCRGPLDLPVLPRLPWECSCALSPGVVGETSRKKMDRLGELYDEAILQVLRDWEQEGDPHFGAMWQPGRFVDLAGWPIEALSRVDCFHPSESGHRRVAAGLWNRLTLNMEEKAVPLHWEERPRVRCLRDDDRFPVFNTTWPP